MTLPVLLVEDGLVTDAQVRRLREKRMAGKTLAAAAAAAGMSERAARKWQSGALPSTEKPPRTWRTREDPFVDVWQSEVVPQLVADSDGRLQVLTLFRALCGRHPGRFQPGQLRTRSGGSASGGFSMVPIARCTSSRWRFRVGKRCSTAWPTFSKRASSRPRSSRLLPSSSSNCGFQLQVASQHRKCRRRNSQTVPCCMKLPAPSTQNVTSSSRFFAIPRR